MEKVKSFSLPKLPYDYNALEPYISATQLTLHHDKHHQAYVNGANADFDKLDKARKENADLDMKALLKDLSFNVGGHLLHSIFWENMAPAGKGGGGQPGGALADALNKEFGSFDQFKKEFTKAAATTEGSGWAALAVHPCIDRPLIVQIEKHNVNVYPTFRILMVLDVWEHAYYVDYKNERAKFIDAFWNIVNWDRVNKNLSIAK
ncbi:MAG TPA: superoxide dismutase [Candidatus Limnocylindrales bacterium]|nr:superoxide dismutase [Candidatus Limnocylindrales bacterium]